MAIELLAEDQDFPLTPCALGDRVTYTRSMIYGATAHSLPNAKEAVQEIDELADFIQQQLQLNVKA